MKAFFRGIASSLALFAVLGIVGCEDNEKSSGITQIEGKASGSSMTPEEYAKANAKGASATGGSYPGAKKASAKTGVAPK
ncbi:MAG: hypothetical protein SFX72_17330 [Isosphaeraceae bacterium]|nr:hypothetical protein [Isosphaeraceae bacterium]